MKKIYIYALTLASMSSVYAQEIEDKSPLETQKLESTQSLDQNDPEKIGTKDPLEKINRVVFKFNKKVDTYVAKPVAKGYKYVTPTAVQKAVDNFLTYVKTPYYALNYALQGNRAEFSNQMGRLILNSFTLGLVDIASYASLSRNSTSIGDTLGVYGVPSGPYLMLPLLGPSSLRDVSSPLMESPTYARTLNTSNTLPVTLTNGLNARANLIGADSVFEEAALDEYAFLRDGWVQQRSSKIEDLKDSK